MGNQYPGRGHILNPLSYSASGILFVLLLLSNQANCQQQQQPSLNTSTQDLQPISVVNNQQKQQQQNVSSHPSSGGAGKRSVDNNAEEHKCGALAAGFMLLDVADSRLNLSDPLDANLSRILDRDGPDMRPSRDYKDFKDITMELSKRAWRLLHEHVNVAVREQIELAAPTLERLLGEARVSANCSSSIGVLFEGAKRMDSWALRLLNSWGHFPMSGIYEGTYGSVGSFQTCLDIEENSHIGHAHYCSVTFRPLMPSQKDYELIVRKEPKELRQMFEKMRHDTQQQHQQQQQQQAPNSTTARPLNYATSSTDAFTDVLEHAQYHHFLHYKWGTCWPIQCSPFDVRRVAKAFGRRSILLNGPVKCYSKFADDYEQPEEPLEERLHGQVAVVAPHLTVSGNQTLSHAGSNGTNSAQSPPPSGNATRKRKLVISVWDRNNGIFIWKPHFTRAHKVALSVLALVTAFIALMTTIDLLVVRLPPLWRKLRLCLRAMPLDLSELHGGNGASAATSNNNTFALCGVRAPEAAAAAAGFTALPTSDEDNQQISSPSPPPPGFFMSLVDDCSAVTNFASFFRVSEGQMKNDILCLNGIRCITMIWIIMTHTMMYNDWSAFARTRAIEVALNSALMQPLFNASYLVDTFFLMSGLLSAFTAFKHCQGQRARFNSLAFIFGRWLRLTPQIFLVSMAFIVFPTLSYGPHWYPIVGEYSENCVRNWWINVLHLQAFYKKEEMCNFVTWWISIDFFYHFFALAVIWAILLGGHRAGSTGIAGVIGLACAWQSWRHYSLALPPNVFSTIPQTGAMWTRMTLDFFWTPYTHSVPFFFGFYLGYLMALKRKLLERLLNTRRALLGWTLAVSLLVGQSYSTYWWVTGQADYSRAVSTSFFGACSFIWAGSLCWIILACQHGYGGFVNTVLSWRVFIVLGKSSYLIYLSHFMVLFMYFGNQHTFLEPTTINMAYIVLGNILLSTLLGIGLCSVYEIPWLKMHRRLMKYV